MAPLIHEYKKNRNSEIYVCVTGQHRQMLDQVLTFFSIKPDFDLNLMSAGQNLNEITAKILIELRPIIQKCLPDNIFVQGDTTSALIGALAAFYEKIDVSHLEAGLRSNDRYSPFPEEINRKLVSQIAQYHFAPTQNAVENLQREGILKRVYLVGNTVIDALNLGLEIIDKNGEAPIRDQFKFLNFNKKIILITVHRRESFGDPFTNICESIAELAVKYEDVQFVYPVHLNPNVLGPAKKILSKIKNIHLIDPLPYPELIWLMKKCFFILTDSGGIQEEAPGLGKPVLVLRDVTERPEGIEAGVTKLVGTNRDVIIDNASTLLTNQDTYNAMSRATNPYGNGTACRKIVDLIG
jgi:UDP-N-acetylglucosamine 2-epimerase (non-hydrolysing)